MEERAVTIRYSPSYVKSLNGLAERDNRSFSETLRAVLTFAQRPIEQWSMFHDGINYVQFRSPNALNPGSKTSYEMLYKVKPPVYYFRILGSPAYVLTADHVSLTKTRVSYAGYLVAYTPEPSPGYVIYNPTTHRCCISWTVNTIFDEYYLFRQSQYADKHKQDYSGLFMYIPTEDVPVFGIEAPPMHTFPSWVPGGFFRRYSKDYPMERTPKATESSESSDDSALFDSLPTDDEKTQDDPATLVTPKPQIPGLNNQDFAQAVDPVGTGPPIPSTIVEIEPHQVDPHTVTHDMRLSGARLDESRRSNHATYCFAKHAESLSSVESSVTTMSSVVRGKVTQAPSAHKVQKMVTAHHQRVEEREITDVYIEAECTASNVETLHTEVTSPNYAHCVMLSCVCWMNETTSIDDEDMSFD